MAVITMWRSADRSCVLLVGEAQFRYTLRVIEGTSVLRSEGMPSADQAFLVAEVWREQEHGSVHGAVTPQ